jgi:hypothetical protein
MKRSICSILMGLAALMRTSWALACAFSGNTIPRTKFWSARLYTALSALSSPWTLPSYTHEHSRQAHQLNAATQEMISDWDVNDSGTMNLTGFLGMISALTDTIDTERELCKGAPLPPAPLLHPAHTCACAPCMPHPWRRRMATAPPSSSLRTLRSSLPAGGAAGE